MTAVKKAIIILSLCAIWFGGMLIGFGVGTAMADEKHSAPSGTDRRVEINENTGKVTSGKCGRVFEQGFLVDDGGTTVEEEE